ncbi:MAG: hypothetical protein IPK15_20720 [Verrucomicrobia bacterium]|nr:hypothetical protein [Verrucomicrobiota bacterium]
MVDDDILEKDPFEFESKFPVQVQVANVRIHRMHINLLKTADQEHVIEKEKRGSLSDPFPCIVGSPISFRISTFADSRSMDSAPITPTGLPPWETKKYSRCPSLKWLASAGGVSGNGG